ncbi:hypothetical protein D8B26_007563 [Coccidioides posadasii str. Silveira]|uniref:Predicted protein n=1 Tax=Coccidioides posadasii (strain RMSCC 757 / Silveira) TaxID=443226 RepID=E9D2B1_COCPS|nr:predicted protein [Coccidioides posadasii str. Silveira]QVM12946.1 hypothetical protein D8B26_007563 [Coccidioides posadasii str. Silveira]
MSKKKIIFTTITTWTTGTPSSSPLPTHFLAKREHAHHVFQWKRHTLSDQSATRQSKCRPRTPVSSSPGIRAMTDAKGAPRTSSRRRKRPKFPACAQRSSDQSTRKWETGGIGRWDTGGDVLIKRPSSD